MEATTPAPPAAQTRLSTILVLVRLCLIAVLVWFLSRRGLWPLALLVIIAVELWPYRRQLSWRLPATLGQPFIAGATVALMITLYPRAISQIVIAVLYVPWRYWLGRVRPGSTAELVSLLVAQGLAFEALFLVAAIWHPPYLLVLAAIWLAAYGLVQPMLAARGERSAGLLAAAWGLVCVEVAWICLRWLVSYLLIGGYLIVPQPVVILSGLGYCFGNIYLSARAGRLNRARLTEFLMIGLIIIAIVIAGTPWHGQV